MKLFILQPDFTEVPEVRTALKGTVVGGVGNASEMFSAYTRPNFFLSQSFIFERSEANFTDLSALMNHFDDMKGDNGNVFLLPSFFNELEPSGTVASGATYFDVGDTSYVDIHASQWGVFLLNEDGEFFYSRIQGRQGNRMFLETPVSGNFYAGHTIAGFIYSVRFAQGLNIEFSNEDVVKVKCVFRVCEEALPLERVVNFQLLPEPGTGQGSLSGFYFDSLNPQIGIAEDNTSGMGTLTGTLTLSIGTTQTLGDEGGGAGELSGEYTQVIFP